MRSQIPKNKKRQTKKRDVVKFCPQKTTNTPPHLCWEIILCSANVAAHLNNWGWILKLRQVSRGFNAAIQPDLWMRWQCAYDAQPMIWKKKADEVLALTIADLAHVECTVHCGAGYMRYKETHLMWRNEVLNIALAKHGGTFGSINAIFLKRLMRKQKRLAKQKRLFNFKTQRQKFENELMALGKEIYFG